jgi:2-keto-4-pentenoate hydratase/2-oxohepta-3-ene-1,7-dioic acid hydratase in catechol pathway
MRILRLRHGGIDYWAEEVDASTARLLDGAPYAGGRATDRFVPSRRESLLPPVTPSKIVCVGRNYRDHAKELGHEVPKEPLLFLKPPSSLLAPFAAIELPKESERVEHEGELTVVIGRPLRRATREEAAAAIFGVTAANDVTARDLQKRDVQFTRGKGFDTFCPVGSVIETEPGPLESLRVITKVDGAERQNGAVADMIWPVDVLLAYISDVMTLNAGDIVLTGTPAGVGPLTPGCTVTVEISPGGPALESSVIRDPRTAT